MRVVSFDFQTQSALFHPPQTTEVLCRPHNLLDKKLASLPVMCWLESFATQSLRFSRDISSWDLSNVVSMVEMRVLCRVCRRIQVFFAHIHLPEVSRNAELPTDLSTAGLHRNHKHEYSTKRETIAVLLLIFKTLASLPTAKLRRPV